MIENLYVAWQDESTRSWHTVARLTRLTDGYEFVFTEGARRLQDIPEGLFGMGTGYRYEFSELIPVFRNRFPSPRRTDFEQLKRWLNLEGTESEFESLSRFGLIPGTDSLLVYPEPSVRDQRYSLEFFVHGVRHMHPGVQTWCSEVEVNAPLLPMLDVQNPVDRNAVALRAERGTILIGYVPAFYALDIKILLSNPQLVSEARFSIVQCNKDAPEQLRLLCKFESPVEPGFVAFSGESHQPIFKPSSATDGAKHRRSAARKSSVA